MSLPGPFCGFLWSLVLEDYIKNYEMNEPWSVLEWKCMNDGRWLQTWCNKGCDYVLAVGLTSQLVSVGWSADLYTKLLQLTALPSVRNRWPRLVKLGLLASWLHHSDSRHLATLLKFPVLLCETFCSSAFVPVIKPIPDKPFLKGRGTLGGIVTCLSAGWLRSYGLISGRGQRFISFPEHPHWLWDPSVLMFGG
jgi:hypothetical protein